jgi:dipeptidyl aminopeptidase/acylaminoacyl peptidase
VRSSSAPPPPGPKESRIYLYADLRPIGEQDKIQGLLAIDPDGGSWARVADAESGLLRVAPGGKAVAFSKYSSADDGFAKFDTLWLRPLDGDGDAEPRKIADVGGLPVWSGDGKEIIVGQSDVEDRRRGRFKYDTWRVGLDGAKPVKLAIPERDEVDDWSADGRWLATITIRPNDIFKGYHIYVMHPDGTGERCVADEPGTNLFPRFSPDGRRVAYSHLEPLKDNRWGPGSLRVVDLDGKNRTTIYTEGDDGFPEQLSWSPDGKRLACVLGNRSPRGESPRKLHNDGILIVGADGKDARVFPLPEVQFLGPPDWR